MSISEGWVEIARDELIPSRRQRLLRSCGVEVDPERVLSVLMAEPLTQDVLLPEAAFAQPAGTMGYLVPGTRVFIHGVKAKDVSWDALTAATVFVLTGSVTVAGALPLLQRALRTMRMLSEDEADLAVVLAALSGGRPYDIAVPDAAVAAAYEEDASRVAPLLKRMRKRGIVERIDDAWRLVK